jgi:hypothetical protein
VSKIADLAVGGSELGWWTLKVTKKYWVEDWKRVERKLAPDSQGPTRRLWKWLVACDERQNPLGSETIATESCRPS